MMCHHMQQLNKEIEKLECLKFRKLSTETDCIRQNVVKLHNYVNKLTGCIFQPSKSLLISIGPHSDPDNVKYKQEMADSTFSTSLINHISNYPLRQKPPLQKSTQPFSTTTNIHSAFFHLY